MDAKVVWQGQGMAFEGVSNKGQPVMMGGKEEPGPSPMEMLLMGLGGCTGMDCILVLQKKKEDVRGFEIVIHTERADSFPQKFTKIEMEYIFTGKNLDADKVERAVDLSSNKYCSVKGSLDPAIEFTSKITINEID
ncbi:MAG: OsmC family protein [Anaerolineaceae bacterium]|nr:OsmC family protein [Anaerolineaceae bacterium]